MEAEKKKDEKTKRGGGKGANFIPRTENLIDTRVYGRMSRGRPHTEYRVYTVRYTIYAWRHAYNLYGVRNRGIHTFFSPLRASSQCYFYFFFL